MDRILKPLLVQKQLKQVGLYLFTPLEFQRLFDVSRTAAQQFLERYTQRGLFVRLKKGLYGLQEQLPSELVIANRLYQPSYISLETALAYYHIIPESIYVTTSVTTKPTREFTVIGKSFNYRTVKPTIFTGYTTVQIDGRTALIAEPEKALIDYLYFLSLSKNQINSRLNITGLNQPQLYQYARLTQNSKVIRLLDQLSPK